MLSLSVAPSLTPPVLSVPLFLSIHLSPTIRSHTVTVLGSYIVGRAPDACVLLP